MTTKPGTTTVNAFKMLLERVPPAAPRPFVPLKAYVLPRADERARYASLPSQYK